MSSLNTIKSVSVHHKLRSITQIKSISILTTKNSKCDPCAKKPKKKKGIFGFFERRRQRKIEQYNLKKLEDCRRMHEADCDPDLSAFGDESRVFRTEGVAHIVVKDKPPIVETQMNREDKILRKIEANWDMKNFPDIEMPPFVSVEQRMMELDKKKLHLFYKKFMRTPPKKLSQAVNKLPKYKFREKYLNIEDIPIEFNLETENLQKKNIYTNFKKTRPNTNLLLNSISYGEKPAETVIHAKRFWKDYVMEVHNRYPSDTLHQKSSQI